MIEAADFISAFQSLYIDRYSPVIVHSSLSAFGEVRGGADAVLRNLLAAFQTVVMPAFTYKTMVVPEEGPPDNGLIYGSSCDANLMADIYRPEISVDRLMGVIPERLRCHPTSRRSCHPILSFVGLNAESLLDCQTLGEPLKPIQMMMESQGWVLLLGVDHTVNTSVHLGERLAGRKQFIRWAITQAGVQECFHFPGCSDGFNQIAPHLSHIIRQTQVGKSFIQAVPVRDVVFIAKALVEKDPLALLCDRTYCERCQAVRNQATRKVKNELDQLPEICG